MKYNELIEAVSPRPATIYSNITIPQYIPSLLAYRAADIHGATIDGNFDCSKSQIENFEGGPDRVQGDVHCPATLKSFKGAPRWIGGLFSCRQTKITNLHNIHKHLQYIGGTLYLPNTIKSHILGVLYIRGMQEVDFIGTELIDIEEILNKHIEGIPHPKDRDIHKCQEELIEAGLAKYAQL